MMIRW